MKKYIIFGGVNGAGKTTLYQTYPEMMNMPRVNVDEIVRGLGDWKNPKDVAEAGRIAVRAIKQYFDEGRSFNQETTLCGKSILRNIQRAKDYGYYIELYYDGLESADLAKKRVAQRVIAGGHGIPDADIERRYKESLEHLRAVINLCDRVELYDNSLAFRQVAVFKNGKCVDKAEIVPLWCQSVIEL